MSSSVIDELTFVCTEFICTEVICTEFGHAWRLPEE